METLQQIDIWLFRSIHVGWANSLLDTLCPLFRNPYFWSPLYFFLLVWMWTKYKWRGLMWCALFIITFGFCDALSASMIKPYVHRIRPCHNPALADIIRHIVNCGSGFSFPSSHASNHFGMSFFMLGSLPQIRREFKWLILLWAILVSLSQVYVGVHYPFDVFAGACLGAIIGTLNAAYWNRRFSFSHPLK